MELSKVATVMELNEFQKAIADYWQRRVDCVPEFDVGVLVLGALLVGWVFGRIWPRSK